MRQMAKRHAKRLTALYLGDEKNPQQNWNNNGTKAAAEEEPHGGHLI